MIDFTPMREGELSYKDYATRENIGTGELRALSDESIDFLLGLLDGLTDADIVFDPEDPDANDPFAVAGEEEIGWSFGHLVAHVTASSEEGAALSSLLARGVAASERPRYETPWRDMQTVAQARQRIEESQPHAQRLSGYLARRAAAGHRARGVRALYGALWGDERAGRFPLCPIARSRAF